MCDCGRGFDIGPLIPPPPHKFRGVEWRWSAPYFGAPFQLQLLQHPKYQNVHLRENPWLYVDDDELHAILETRPLREKTADRIHKIINVIHDADALFESMLSNSPNLIYSTDEHNRPRVVYYDRSCADDDMKLQMLKNNKQVRADILHMSPRLHIIGADHEDVIMRVESSSVHISLKYMN